MTRLLCTQRVSTSSRGSWLLPSPALSLYPPVHLSLATPPPSIPLSPPHTNRQTDRDIFTKRVERLLYDHSQGIAQKGRCSTSVGGGRRHTSGSWVLRSHMHACAYARVHMCGCARAPVREGQGANEEEERERERERERESLRKRGREGGETHWRTHSRKRTRCAGRGETVADVGACT